MLVAGAGEEPALLDFFVAAPGLGADGGDARRAAARRRLLRRRDAGASTSARRRAARRGCRRALPPRSSAGGRAPATELAAPAAALARAGVARQRRAGLRVRDPRADPPHDPAGPSDVRARRPRAARGRAVREPGAGRDASSASGPRAPRRSTTGDIADAVVDVGGRAAAGCSPREDLAAYEAVAREPVRVRYRGRDVLTNPPPSAGGTLLALALALLDAHPGPPRLADVVAVMEAAQAAADARVRRRAWPSPASRSASSQRASARRRTSRSWTPPGWPAR